MEEREHRVKLYERLAKRFDKEELREICFRLDITYDNLSGKGKASKARELIGYLERHNRISEFLQIGKQLRPDISWDDIHLKTIDIPFVIAAMTHNEATKLVTETIFDDPQVAPVERARFQRLKELLQEHGITDLLTCYGERREDWKPQVHQQNTVETTILEIVDLINQQRPGMSSSPPVNLQPYSLEFFAQDRDTRSETWDELERLGCIIIVDAISMFHPTLHHLLLQSGMGANKRVAMLVLSPVNFSAIPVNQLIEREISSQMHRAFDRYNTHLDKLCEFGVGDLCTFRRWLFAILPETATIVQNQKPHLPTRTAFSKRMGGSVGFDRLVFGEGGG